MKRLMIITIMGMSMLQLQAQSVQVRTYTSAEKSQTSGNKVVVRKITPLAPPKYTDERLFAFSVMPGLETPERSMDVGVLRLSFLVGAHRCVHVLDLNLIGGISDYEMNGVGFSGIFNKIGTSSGAFQLAGICNYSGWNMSGVQISALWNWAEGEFSGMQVGLVNKSGRLCGFQLGGINMAEQGSGVQIGAINISERLEGLQIGVINVNRDSSMPLLPIINFAF